MQKDAWATVISNPALVVGSGTEDAVRYTLLPVLKARSIRPCGMLSWGNGKAERAGEKELEKEYPGIRNWGAEFGECPSGNGGYGRAMHLCWKIFLSRCARESVRPEPGVVMGMPRRRFLMIGNTGFSSLARAEKTPRADVLLIGHHPRDPVDSAAWIRATGARAVIFTTEHECPVPEGTAVYRLRETGTLYLRMEEKSVQIIP